MPTKIGKTDGAAHLPQRVLAALQRREEQQGEAERDQHQRGAVVIGAGRLLLFLDPGDQLGHGGDCRG